jgi:hypothetical protein
MAAFCLFFLDSSIETAIGSAFAVAAVEGWRVINGDFKTCSNFTPLGAAVIHFLNLVHAICAYAIFTDQDWATKLITYWSWFGLLNGIGGSVSPVSLVEAYQGQKGEMSKGGDTLQTLFYRSAHFALAGCAILVLCLLNDVDKFQAFGYAAIATAMHFVWINFVTKEVKTLGNDRLAKLHYTWLVAFAIVTLPLLTKE